MDEQAEKRLLRSRMRRVRDSMPVVDRARGSEVVCRKLLGLEEVRAGAVVALYAPMGSELDLAAFVRAAGDTLTLLAPVTLGGRRMEFVRVTPDELLAGAGRPAGGGGLAAGGGANEGGRHAGGARRDGSGLAAGGSGAGRLAGTGGRRGEADPRHAGARPGHVLAGLPEGREAVAAADVDLMVVPGLAFDRICRRLGYGGGYYDAYLARPELRARVVGVCFDEQLCAADLPAEEHDRRMDLVLTPAETLA